MKLGWRISFVVLALGTGLFLSRKPWGVLREQQSKTNQIEQEMQLAEKERERLMKEKSKLDSPLGKEELVRGQGLIRPGETAVER